MTGSSCPRLPPLVRAGTVITSVLACAFLIGLGAAVIYWSVNNHPVATAAIVVAAIAINRKDQS